MTLSLLTWDADHDAMQYTCCADEEKDEMISSLLDVDFRELSPLKSPYCKKQYRPNRLGLPVRASERSCFDGDSCAAALQLMAGLFLKEGGFGYANILADSFHWTLKSQRPECANAEQEPTVGAGGIGLCELIGTAKEEGSSLSSRIILRGDTLLTYKAMAQACLHGPGRPSPYSAEDKEFLRSLEDEKGVSPIETCDCGHTSNNQHTPSLFLLPYKPGNSLNCLRGVVRPYCDNPFSFMDRLRTAYSIEDVHERELWGAKMGQLEKAISNTWDFWGLFGTGKEGFNLALNTLLLEGLNDSDFIQFVTVDPEDIFNSGKKKARIFLARYYSALSEIGRRRKESMRKRMRMWSSSYLFEQYHRAIVIPRQYQNICAS